MTDHEQRAESWNLMRQASRARIGATLDRETDEADTVRRHFKRWELRPPQDDGTIEGVSARPPRERRRSEPQRQKVAKRPSPGPAVAVPVDPAEEARWQAFLASRT
jgi:hypothetical protein